MVTIREEKMSNELLKHHLIGLPFDAVIHEFMGKDKGNPHCHPFSFTSTVLHGAYLEKIYTVLKDGTWEVSYEFRKEGDSFTVLAETVHELIDLPYGDCYTIIKPGQKYRESRFWDFSRDIAKSKAWNEDVWI